MKIKKSLVALSLLLVLVAVCGYNISNATVRSNDPTVESGGTVSITISTTNAVESFKIELADAGGLTFQSASVNSAFTGSVNGSTVNGITTSANTTLATYTFKTPTVSETKTYSVKFNISNMGAAESSTTNTSTVTVKAPEKNNNTNTNNTGNQTNNTGNETNNEPTFTSANDTVYATGDINVRKSYTTSSQVVGTLKKGESVTRTGIGSNGWSRVTYNGTTAYISTSLLTTKKPEETEDEKSSNTNLKTLSIEGYTLSPKFSASVVGYSIQITDTEIDKLNIVAEAEDDKATVTIEGNNGLEFGDNTIQVIVKAEDGTTKTYTITATMAEEFVGLSSLEIKDTDIANKFKTDLYEYEIDIKNLDKLDIVALANKEGATVEILGNEDLQEGENLITIIVRSADETQVATYQIKVNKTIVQIANLDNGFNTDLILYGVIALIGIILLAIAVIYVVRKRRMQEEFGYNEEDDDYYNQNEKHFNEEEQVESEENKNYFNSDEQSEEILNYKEKDESDDTEEDYFLNDSDDDKTKRRRGGKHF